MLVGWVLHAAWAEPTGAVPRGVEAGVAPPPGLERAYASRRVALVVGIDQFVQPDVDDLSYAAKDARDLARVLEDPRVGAYDVVSVVAGEVPRDAFWSAFRSVASTVQRDDTVLVYVATHGTLDLGPGGAELFLLGSDSSLTHAADTAIRVAELADALGSLPARRTVMILDACYAGTGRSVVAPEVRRKLDHARGAVPAPPALVASALSAHLYSAHLHQPALEDPNLQNGVYTHFLVEALRGDGDADGDGLVEVMEAHDWARDRTLAYTGGSQVPWAETVLVGRQELFLTGDPSRRAALEEALLDGLQALPADAVVTIDGVRRGAGPVGPGPHAVEVRQGDDVLAAGTWRAGPGDVLDVSRWTAQRGLGIEVGVAGVASAGWFGAAGALDLRVVPPDATGGRPWFGASGRVGARHEARRWFPTGATLAEAGWAWSAGAVAAGPVATAGFVWRLPQGARQASPAVGGGAELAVGGAWGVRVRAAALVFEADGAPAVAPSLSAGIATRR